jgi:hypothetical protein
LPAHRPPAALDSLAKLFAKYANVRTAGSYVTLEPAMQYDRKAIFRRPWIAPGG